MSFESKSIAKQSAKRIKNAYVSRDLFAYKCKQCKYWHLTSYRPAEQRRIEKRMNRYGLPE